MIYGTLSPVSKFFFNLFTGFCTTDVALLIKKAAALASWPQRRATGRMTNYNDNL